MKGVILFLWNLLAMSLLLLSLISCSEDGQVGAGGPHEDKLTTGFFAPTHVDRYIPFVKKTMLNVPARSTPGGGAEINLERLAAMFEYASGYDHQINLDLGYVITDTRKPSELNLEYLREDGELTVKVFKPMQNNKLKKLVSGAELTRRLSGLPELVKKYRKNVGYLLLVDEPYLNGVPPEEIDRAIRSLRKIFADAGVTDLSFGVIFASAFFNEEFAKSINSRMMKYAEDIDDYYLGHKHLLEDDSAEADRFRRWLDVINNYRLTTYDTANNMYLEGGLPEEVDFAGFNFYLSTLLFDQIHEHSLAYFYDIGMQECGRFKGVGMADIRRRLSFIQDGPLVEDPLAMTADKRLLDELFLCRMSAATKLLDAEIAAISTGSIKSPTAFMVAESSANGVFEFDKKGNIEQNQPYLLVEKRIYDEVHRAHLFYKDYANYFQAGLYFFLYPDSFDRSINLRVSGAEGAKSVLTYIYSFSRPATNDLEKAQQLPAFNQWLTEYKPTDCEVSWLDALLGRSCDAH